MITLPPALLTSMIPTMLGNPEELGNEGSSTTRLFPSSDTVIEKSVPRTEIFAVGVSTLTFSRVFFAIRPEAYLTVPKAVFIESLPFSEDAS